MLDEADQLVLAIEAGDHPLALKRTQRTAEAIDALALVLHNAVVKQQARELRLAARRIRQLRRHTNPES
jgi:hypothetical protein